MTESLRVGVISDDISDFNISGDTTFAFAIEAQQRGHQIWSILPNHIKFSSAKVSARVRKITLKEQQGNHVQYEQEQELELSESFDVLMIRQDPPFDMHYISLTHILELIADKVKIVNDPAGVRNAPEKLSVLKFLKYHPRSAIAFDKRDIVSAVGELSANSGSVVIKPLFGNGGEGILRIQQEDPNLHSAVDLLLKAYPRQPLIVQEYLLDITKGDKRILIINGKVAGAINRIPHRGDIRANLHVGGAAELAELTSREQQICDDLAGFFLDNGLFFVGIDTIGDMLTEINVTSPTGVRELLSLGGDDLSKFFWQELEQQLKITT